jgi:phage shock protein C
MDKKLYRSPVNKVVAGVAGGLGDYFGIDPVLVRVLFVVATISAGVGVITYLLLWIIMPEEKAFSGSVTSDGLPDANGDLNKDLNAEQPTDTAQDFFQGKSKRTVISGIVLILIGTFFLIKTIFPMLTMKYLWPLILIAVGSVIIYNSIRNKN